ncbi:MAG: hypothetical protein HRU15_13285 [Planctomycetes bacterium]|nr:hypothetical protein [Planctomycetota bacterium]
MLKTSYSHLNTIQKGYFGEAYAKMAFTLEGFEVYSTEYDDRGIDFVVRNTSGKFFSIQAKSFGDNVNPFIYADKFQCSDDFIFCAVHLSEGQQASVYVACGNEWEDEDLTCLHHNPGGGKSGPYYEMRFAHSYVEQLKQFAFHKYTERIR